MFRGRQQGRQGGGFIRSRTFRTALGSAVLLFVLLVLGSLPGASQTWPRCIDGCTANDVELEAVTAEVLGSCSPGGTVDATLWVSLHFNRNNTYCVRFVADVYVDGELAIADLVSDPFNVYSKGAYPDVYLATIPLPCGSVLTLENAKIMWSVDNKLDPVSNCQDGTCTDYGPGSKCTGDDFGVIAVSLPPEADVNQPPDAVNDEVTTKENKSVKISVLDNDSDPDGDNLTVDSLTQPDHGTVEMSGKKINYTPDKDCNGIDTFTYTISDSNGGTATATVTVMVGTLSQKPEANDDSAMTDEGVPVDIDILANDSDGDGMIDPTTVTITKNPGDGSVSVHPTSGVVTYTPDAGVCEDDYFRYTIKDDAGIASDEAKVDVEVLCNQAPEAEDDSAVTCENASVDIDVAANDSDSDGSVDSTTVVITKAPKNGVANVNPATGAVTYIPEAGFCGDDYFKYTISDNDGAISNEAKVDIEVLCNEAPEAEDDSATTNENTSVGIAVVANDADSNGTVDPSTIVITRDPREGTLSVHPSTGVITYTPDPGSCGDDYFKYTINDNDGATSNEAKVDIEVLCNDPPLAIDDLYTANEGQMLTVSSPGVLSNDIDAPGSPLSAILIVGVEHGTLTLDADGSFVYVHDGSETTSDEFTYVANDANSDSNVATVNLVISPTNDQPTATDDSESTKEDKSVKIAVLKNDTDPDDDDLSVDWVTQPTNGLVVNNGDTVTYTPDPNFNGTDTFTYGISDGGGGTASATVTVTVTAENDPPIAQADTDATNEEVPVTINVLANDSDPDGDSLAVTSVTQAGNGDVDNNGADVSYTPDPGFNGIDTFTYTVTDGNGGEATATVTVAVAMVNDPPLAMNDTTSTREDRPVTIAVLSNDSDPDNDSLIIESVSLPQHGAVVLSGASVVYTPSPNYNGADTFRYTVTDGNGGTSTATVLVTVIAENDPPRAQDDSTSTNEGVSIDIAVLGNDSDPDADPLTVESLTQPDHGRAINNGDGIDYTPDPGFSGTDTFSYTVSDDNGGNDTATVIVTVIAANNPPTAQDDSASTDEGVLVTIPVLANDRDPDNDFLLVETFSNPANGSVLNTRTGLSYIPDDGFEGIDTFSYTVSDGNGGTDTAIVTVSVAGVNEAPVANDDNRITDEDVELTILVLENDSDPDRDDLVIQSVEQPESGTVTNNGTSLTYTPDPGTNGVDVFTYIVADGNGGTDEATVFVAVAPVNNAPNAQNDSGTTEQDTPFTIAVLNNDSDPDGDLLTIETVTQPANGSLVNDGRQITYIPNEGFAGTDTFEYVVVDDNGLTDTALVTVGVASAVGGGGARSGAVDETACTGRVVISEIAWAGTASDPRDEWIELQNLGTAPVDLTGWVLRWRRTHPSTPEEQIWKVVELSGILAPASVSACEQALEYVEPGVQFIKDPTDDVSWKVLGELRDVATGFYTLERRHDATVSNVKADLVYDTAQTLNLELSDLGEIVMLVNPYGEVVDTANASNLGRNGWVAGNTATFATMERIDALGEDVAANWNTNMGIVIHGEDARSRPLHATAGEPNSPVLETLQAAAGILPMTVRSGTALTVDFTLPRQERKVTGWPWISVVRPGFTGVAGTGGSSDVAGYSFSGGYEGGEKYALDIGTEKLPPGSYTFWIIYGAGEALLLPIIVTP